MRISLQWKLSCECCFLLWSGSYAPNWDQARTSQGVTTSMMLVPTWSPGKLKSDLICNVICLIAETNRRHAYLPHKRRAWVGIPRGVQGIFLLWMVPLGFPGGPSSKEPACQCRRHKWCGFNPWVGKKFWSRTWQPTPAFLPGESHG